MCKGIRACDIGVSRKAVHIIKNGGVGFEHTLDVVDIKAVKNKNDGVFIGGHFV